MAAPPEAALRIYIFARCTTCRAALAWLQARGLVADPIDITTQPPSLQELRAALEQLGRARLFNTSGQSYRVLGPAAVKAMDDEQALRALAADGRLVKRPFLITPAGRVLTGFRAQQWAELLGCPPD